MWGKNVSKFIVAMLLATTCIPINNVYAESETTPTPEASPDSSSSQKLDEEGEFIGDVDPNQFSFSNNYLNTKSNVNDKEAGIQYTDYDAEGNIVNNMITPIPKGLSVINTYGENEWSRAVSTQVSIYARRGTVPNVTLVFDKYNKINYHYFVVTPNNETIVQVDYAGNTPQTLNNFVDSELTNSSYWFVGSINGGYFTNSGDWPGYGYPTGAVKTHDQWQYWYDGNGGSWECTPDHNAGYVTAYWTDDDLELVYNGWDLSLYNEWGQVGDWYGDINGYENAISGSYTLFANGEAVNLSPSYSEATTKFFNYSRSITLFGQLADGRFILLTTEGTCSGSDQYGLLEQVAQNEESSIEDAIRFDGGGSTQMCFDSGLVNIEVLKK